MKTLRSLLKNCNDRVGLSAEAYRCNDFYRLEQQAIFRKSWVPTGLQKSTHNMVPVSVAGTNLLLLTEKNETKAFINACTHRRCKLVENPDTQKKIVCPYHFWNFSLKGELSKAPRVDEFENPDFRARHKLEEVGSNRLGHILFTRLEGAEEDREMENLNHVFGQPIGDVFDMFQTSKFVPVRYKKFSINANWKILVENFLEYLHVPAIHSSLSRSSRVADHIDSEPVGPWHIAFKTDPVRQSKRNPLSKFKVPDWVDPRVANIMHFDCIFPNYFHFHLGNSLFCVFVCPDGPGRSVEHAYMLMPKESIQDKTEEEIDELLGFYEEVNQEDILVCERVQRGIDGSGDMADTHMSMLEPWDVHINRFRSFHLDKMKAAFPEAEFAVDDDLIHSNTSAPSSAF